MAAHRLQLPEWVTWLGHELNGYGPDDAIPVYRHVQGEVLIDGHHGLKGGGLSVCRGCISMATLPL
ncbi:hypothetical protein [Aeromonas caviae]|uniref:AbiTii domain-containing protein n=1 Tax=Aeromonas caviae TaxID=648 RepID=UPI003C700D15